MFRSATECSAGGYESFFGCTIREIVVPDLEGESEVPVAVCTPVQKSVFTADDDFISAV